MTYGNCGHCQFWRRTWDHVQAGPTDHQHAEAQCCKHSPINAPTTTISHYEARWPITRACMGCGDYQPLATEQEQKGTSK